jgi:succinyl-diaminopimelate desuccinylase
VQTLLDGYGLRYDLQWTLIGEPFLTPRGPLVEAVAAAVKDVAGVQPELSTTGGTSDGRFLARLAREVVEFGPLNDSIHKIDECVRVADLEPLSKIYQRAVLAMWRT